VSTDNRPYGDPTDHAKLSKLIPLSTPLSLLIDPANACNYRCRFCPTGHPDLLALVARPIGVMKFDLYRKIIDDATAFPNKLKKLHLYKDGEPFLNKNLARMIEYAKVRDVAYSVETTTNGSLCTPERSREIVDAGLDRIRISVEHVHDEGYRSITRTASSYNNVLANVRALYKEKVKNRGTLHIHVKLVDIGFTDEEKEQFLKDFDGIADELHIDELMGWSDSGRFDFTLGRDPAVGMTRRTQLNRQRLVCPQPFYTLAVNFNGLVSVCCVDWTLNTVVGDCNAERLPDIWNSAKLRDFRLMHLTGQRAGHSACGDCHYIFGMSANSDLDKERERLLQLFDPSR
jgi:MoaA/NifB/PqqE/SkfB family radical SAM enzyme